MNKKITLSVILSVSLIVSQSLSSLATVNQMDFNKQSVQQIKSIDNDVTNDIKIISKNMISGDITESYIKKSRNNKNTMSAPAIPPIQDFMGFLNQRQFSNIPRKIIGSDNRYELSKYINWLCYLEMVYKNGKSYFGTGFVIANNAIATAGHVVYSHDNWGWPEYIRIYPGVNRSYQPFGNFTSTTLHTLNNWINYRNYSFDVGIIEVNNNIWLRTGLYGYSYNNSSYNGINGRIDGYPREGPRQQWSMSGKIYGNSNNNLLYYSIDTTKGQSGAPICLPGGNNAIGVHSGDESAGNRGTRISQDIFNWFNSFRK